MVKGILAYEPTVKILGTDFLDRGFTHPSCELVYGIDGVEVSNEDYPFKEADYVIMNPPYVTITPFVLRALSLAKKGVLLLGRLQFVEGDEHFQKIFKDNPPTKMLQYVERIQCWKDGVKPEGSGSQAYAWFYWDLTDKNKSENTALSWIHRIEK